jgi:hypothetical protein
VIAAAATGVMSFFLQETEANDTANANAAIEIIFFIIVFDFFLLILKQR